MDDSLFSATVLEKLPLADAVWHLLRHALDDAWLEDLWARKRGRCYERELKFSTLAHLIGAALLEHGGSGNQTFKRAREAGTLPVADTSAYEKLGHLPVPLSEAFLEEGSRRLGEALPEAPAVDPLPECWAGFEVFGADGKAIKHVHRLLKPLRGLRAGILGARASVGLNLRTGLAVAMVGHLDGEAGEAALTDALMPKLAAAAGARPWLLVLDRLYCNLTFPKKVLEARGHFLVRHCANTTFVPDPTRPARESHDAEGHRIIEEWGWLGKAAKEGRLYVRRVAKRPASGPEIGLVTDLVDEVKFPAEAVLATYRKRWGIETVFHQITDVFSLRHLIGSTPQATLFQMSFCLLLYNALQVVRGHLAAERKCEAKSISNEKLFYDVRRQLVAVNELIRVETLISLLGPTLSAHDLRGYIREALRGAWSDRWWKAPSSGRGGHQKVKKRVLGNHTSTYRVLQQT